MPGFHALRARFGHGRGADAGSDDGSTPAQTAISALEREQRLVRIYFGVGLTASGILGSVALLVVLSLAAGPGADRWNWFSGSGQPAAWGLYDALPRPDRAGGTLSNPDLVTLDFPISAHERGGAPLRLEDSGRHAWLHPGTSALVLRNVPAMVTFSRGARDPSGVWRLQTGDLPFLYVIVPHTAPAAFDIAIDAVDRAGTARTAAIARVRVRTEPSDLVARQPKAAARPGQAQHPSALVRDAVGAAPEPVRSQQQPRAQQATPAARQPAARPAESAAPAAGNPAAAPYPAYNPRPRAEIQRPSGMSGLGGPGREAQADTSGEWWRTIWWRLPSGNAFAQPGGAR